MRSAGSRSCRPTCWIRWTTIRRRSRRGAHIYTSTEYGRTSRSRYFRIQARPTTPEGGERRTSEPGNAPTNFIFQASTSSATYRSSVRCRSCSWSRPEPAMHEPGLQRILMTADTVGGVWTFALELTEALAGHGVEVVLAALGGQPSESQRVEAERVP